MPINFIRKTYDQWMKSNHHRFNHKPYIIKNRKNGFTFQFSDIIPELQGYIGKNGTFEIRVFFQVTFWDILTDFDVFASITRDGQFYCRFCKLTYDDGFSKNKPLLYDTKKELWEQHSYEPFLQWANENLYSSHYLCLYGEKDSCTAAYIKTKNEAVLGEWNLILPLIIDK